MERDALLQQMSDADPAVRAAAFEKLRALPLVARCAR